MDFIATLNPELAAVLQALPAESSIDWQDIPGIRAAFKEMLAARSADLLGSPNVATEDSMAPGFDGAPEVPIRIYRPAEVAGPLPAVIWMHGGGFILGSIADDDHHTQHFVEAVNCLGVSVEYRLAPEHPFPAPLEDCYAALKWTHDKAVELGVDRSRIAVGGASAGGNLAAGLALLARDRGEVPIAFQWLLYPALDDRNVTPSSHAITDSRVWNRGDNLNAWRAYLGGEPGSDGISPYAAPARATNLIGLPAAYIQVGSRDLLIDEAMDYVQRLARAGVPVELHVYPGAFHASEAFVPTAALSQRMVSDRIEALKRGLNPELARPPTALAV